MLVNHFPSQGAWLFRYRSILPFAFLPVLIHTGWVWRDSSQVIEFSLTWNLLCLTVSLLGLAIRVATVGFVSRSTSGRNTREQRAGALNTTGLYSIVRHPLYLGNFLIWFGICLPVSGLESVLLFICAFWLYYERIITAEEQFLQERFGQRFLDWAARTPALLPDCSNWTAPALPFCWRSIFSREYCAVLGIGSGFAIINVVQNYITSGVLRLDPLWRIVLAVSFAAFVCMRSLKKLRLIRVEGRC